MCFVVTCAPSPSVGWRYCWIALVSRTWYPKDCNSADVKHCSLVFCIDRAALLPFDIHRIAMRSVHNHMWSQPLKRCSRIEYTMDCNSADVKQWTVIAPLTCATTRRDYYFYAPYYELVKRCIRGAPGLARIFFASLMMNGGRSCGI